CAKYDVINAANNTTDHEDLVTDENGQFMLKDGQKAVFKLDTTHVGDSTDVYYVEELSSEEIYSTSYSINNNSAVQGNKTTALKIKPTEATNVVFANTLNLGSLIIEKEVQGEKTEADCAAESFTFDIKDANLNTVATVKLPTADGAWSTTVENLLFGNYMVKEQNAEISGLLLDTKVIYPGEGANSVEVANGTTPEVLIKNTYAQDLSLIKTGVSVQKQWIDSDNKDKIRPESVTVELYADDVATGQTVTLSEENGWVGMFIALDKYKDSTLIEYTVKETPIPEGYTTAVEGDAENGFIVKNTHIVSSDDYPPTVYTVKKVWEDNNNEAGLRPESITVKVLKNGSEETVVLSEANNWTYTWSGYGTYKVVEINTPEDYTSSINLTGNTFTVTNKYVPEDTPIVTPDVPDVPTGDKEAEDPTVDLGDDGVPTDYMEVDDADVPKTDDNSMLPLWLTIAALSALALVATTIAERKCRE
ncbi:MAG: Cna B-type domain-containing protein, partial [Firmicutes bacterium]|nr:Cna B-type domain-containing protein [Bacillota bacterium]